MLTIPRLVPRDGAPATLAELRAEVERLECRLADTQAELADRCQLLALLDRRRLDPLHLRMDMPNRFRAAEGGGRVEIEEAPAIWSTRDKVVALATLAVLFFAGFVLGRGPS